MKFKQESDLRKPEVFVSAASADLRSYREVLVGALRKIECNAVEQRDFPPAAATVKEKLRKEIGKVDAVIHVVGKAYGKEPSRRESGEPRRSYTQLEYDIARELGKEIYVFVCADDFPYDEHEPEDPEKAELQRRHREELLGSDHAFEPVVDCPDLENRVLRIQERLRQIVRELERQQRWIQYGIAIAVVALVGIGFGLWWIYSQNRGTADEVEKIGQTIEDSALLSFSPKPVSDLDKSDIELVAEFRGGRRGRFVYEFELKPRSTEVQSTLHSSDLHFRFLDSNGEELHLGTPESGLEYYLANMSPPSVVEIGVEAMDGTKSDPLRYQVDLQSEYEAFATQFAERQLEALNESDWLKCFSLNHAGFDAGISLCALDLPWGVEDRVLAARLGKKGEALDYQIGLSADRNDKGVAYNGSVGTEDPGPRWLVPISMENLVGKLELPDGTYTRTIAAEPDEDSVDEEDLFRLNASDSAAPIVTAKVGSMGKWVLTPIVSGNVVEVRWTTYEGGDRKATEVLGLPVIKAKPEVLGIPDDMKGEEPPTLQLTYLYASGKKATYEYSGDWKEWLQRIRLADIDGEGLMACEEDMRGGYSNFVECGLHVEYPAEEIIDKIWWGRSPGELRELSSMDPQKVRERQEELCMASATSSSQNPAARRHAESLCRNRPASRYPPGSQFSKLTDWREIEEAGWVLAVEKPVDSDLYFKYRWTNGKESRVYRVAVE